MIEVLQPGLLTTIQDTGRKGFEAYGVPASGAFDPFLAAVANKLVGNSFDQPLIEFALIGPSLHFHRDSNIAVSGFEVLYHLNGTAISIFSCIHVAAGSVLNFVNMRGWYGYIAVGGGIEREKILGSVSTYLAGGMGKRTGKGEILKTGPETGQRLSLRSGYWKFPEDPVLQLLESQHTTRFSDRDRQKITEHSFQISPQSNRMGIRLEGAAVDSPAIRRSVPAIPGAVQIPRSGSPIILGPEGPTTGGYAQIGSISRASWTVLAARRPGDSLRFEWSDVESARRIWDYRQKLLHTEAAWQAS